MIKVTFSKKGLYGAKGEEREVTDSAALQYAKLGIIESPDKVVSAIEKRREAVAKELAKEQEKAIEAGRIKLAARQAEMAKINNPEVQAKKELKDKVVTKEEKHGAKVTKAPRL